MSSLEAPWRDATATVIAEADALEAHHRRVLRNVPTGHGSVFVRRTARIAAGVTGTLFALAVVVSLASGWIGWWPGGSRSGCPCGWAPAASHAADTVRLLLSAWPAMAGMYVLAAIASGLVLRHRLRRCLVRTDDPFRDAAALRDLDLFAVERAMSSRRGAASYAWPLVAITLLAPHTLQLPFVIPERHALEYAASWMKLTSLLSVHIYLYGVYAALTFPETGEIRRHVTRATVLSLFPGVFLLGMSSAIVLATAAAVAAIGYLPMRAIMRAESAALDGSQPSPWTLSTTWTAGPGT